MKTLKNLIARLSKHNETVLSMSEFRLLVSISDKSDFYDNALKGLLSISATLFIGDDDDYVGISFWTQQSKAQYERLLAEIDNNPDFGLLEHLNALHSRFGWVSIKKDYIESGNTGDNRTN